MPADLLPDALPRCPSTVKSALSTTITKCGFPVDTSTPGTCTPPGIVTVRGANCGTPMPVVTSTDKLVAGAHRVDVAHAHARVCLDLQLVAGLRADRLRHPRRHAARSVAADLRDRAVRIVQANAPRLRSRPCEELDAVRADAGVARAQRSRQFGPVATAAPPLPSQSENRCRRRAPW